MHIIDIVNQILADEAHVRVNGDVASNRTVRAAGEALRPMFRDLHELGFKLEDPKNLSNKHIKALCELWRERALATKTMQGYLSHLRIFCGWINKKGMVKSLCEYLPDVPKDELKTQHNATKSKSWAEAGIDIIEKIQQADQIDWRFGLMVRLMVGFGLRRMEVLQLKPRKNNEGTVLYTKETKGGRPRVVHIDTDIQRAVLEMCKARLSCNETLGWHHRDGKKMTYKQSERRYNYCMEKLGITKELEEVTGHGLRAQYAENAAVLKGVIPPTLGGTAGQLPKEEIDLVRLQVAESLGHSRISITGAYYGSFGRNAMPDDPNRAKDMIQKGLNAIQIDASSPVPAEHLELCGKLVTQLMAIGIFEDPRKVHVLWSHYSKRHATDWLLPEAEDLIAALEVAARSLTGFSQDDAEKS